MKKIAVTAIAATIAFTGISEVSHAQANTKTSTPTKSTPMALKTFTLPSLTNKTDVKNLMAGKYTLQAPNGQKIYMGDSIKQIEKKVGLPIYRDMMDMSDYTEVNYQYGKSPDKSGKPQINLSGIESQRLSDYKLIKIDQMEFYYSGKYSMTTFEKYFGKAGDSYKDEGLYWKTYGDNVAAGYKKVNGKWKVMNVVSTEPQHLIPE